MQFKWLLCYTCMYTKYYFRHKGMHFTHLENIPTIPPDKDAKRVFKADLKAYGFQKRTKKQAPI